MLAQYSGNSAPVSAYVRPAASTPIAPAEPAESAPVVYARPAAAPVYPPVPSPEAISVPVYENPIPYPSEAPTMVESAAVEAPSVIRRPPVMAPRPKKKKSGLILWVIIAVVVAGLIGVTIWGFVDGWLPELFSGSGTSNSGDEGEENEDPYADWNEYELNGLLIYLPDEFDEGDSDENVAFFSGDDVEIRIESMPMSEESIKNADDMAEYFYDLFCDSYEDEIEDNELTVELKKKNGVPYVIMFDDTKVAVIGLYTDGETGWDVAVKCEDPERAEEMIEYATGCELE